MVASPLEGFVHGFWQERTPRRREAVPFVGRLSRCLRVPVLISENLLGPDSLVLDLVCFVARLSRLVLDPSAPAAFMNDLWVVEL